MTTQQIIWMTVGYSIAFIAAVYFTRATTRRVLASLIAAAVAGAAFVGASLLGRTVGWWHFPLPSSAVVLALFFLGAAISLAPMYLITWRVARRFGRPGLTLCLIAVALIGPPRDYLVAAMYPNWMTFAPGLAPILADCAIYVGLVALGHFIMRLVAGPAQGDPLAQRHHRAA